MTDFKLNNHGSLCILIPVSEEAKAWGEEHLVHPETITWCGAYVVEPRYIAEVVGNIESEGMVVS